MTKSCRLPSDWVGLLADAVLKLESASGVPLDDLIVIPVPMHAAKRKQRGFNHAELLAKAAVWELRRQRPAWKLILEGSALERRKVTLSQSGLSPHQRRANLRGVFFVKRPELIAGRDILLIDDIYTTGATTRACSQVLRRAGAASVRVATVARPQREDAVAHQFEAKKIPMEQDVAFWGTPKQSATPLLATAANQHLGTQHHRGFGG